MELYYVLSALIVLSSLFSYINARFIKMPSTVGVMMIAMIVSIALVIFGNLVPETLSRLTSFVKSIDLHDLLMDAMLNFLLFAGALHIRINDLKEQRFAIIIFSSVSVVLSTFVVGILLYIILILFNFPISFIECLIFGALISPTDPIAVLGVLKSAKVPRSIEIKVAGESLFNDGVAVVLFIALIGVAKNQGEFTISAPVFIWHLIKEVLGGLIMGILLGITASRSMKRINSYNVEVMITLAVVMGGSSFVASLGFSGPLAMVTAGLVIGNYGRRRALSELSRDYLDKFWELLDEIMNAILFLLIGLQLLIIPVKDIKHFWVIGLISILIVLTARFFSIWIPTKIIHFKEKFTKKTIAILVWGGLRGGVSVALALSLDESLNKNLFVVITFFVVVFSIFVQGMSIAKIAKYKKGDSVV